MTFKREHNSRGVEKVSQFSLHYLLAELISKVKYKTIFTRLRFWWRLLKVHIVAVAKTAHIGTFKAICKAGTVG